MRSGLTRLLLLGAVVGAVIAACTIDQKDLATTPCSSNSECPGGYVCAAVDGGEGRCQLVFPIAPKGVDASVPDAGVPTYYCSEAKPLLDTYCVSCHGAIAPQNGWRFDVYDTGNGNGAKPHADRVKATVLDHSMPQIDAGQPTEEEREVIVRWVDTGALDCFPGFDAGVPLLDDGGLADGGGTPPDSGTTGGTPDAGIPYVRVQAVWNLYCNGAGCHSGSAPQGGLNLTAGASYNNLVNVNTSCNTAVKRVATTGNPADSMLWRKTSGAAGMCGSVMPTANALVNIDQTSFDVVEEWIKEGAKNL